MTLLLKHSFLKTADDSLSLVEACNEVLKIDYEDKIKCMVWLRRNLFSSTFAFLPFVLDPFFK